MADHSPTRERVLHRLRTRWPLVQAPMAGSQGSALALAVCAAGALGSLPAATLRPEALREELMRLRTQASGPYAVNFFCHAPPQADADREARWRALLQPHYAAAGLVMPDGPSVAARRPFDADAAALLEACRPPVVSFHFGLPEDALLQGLRAWGAVLLSTATTVAEARWLEQHGVDAIIVQGLEAGGHRGHFLRDDLQGQMPLAELLPAVRAAVGLPLIAAGGIADADDVARARAWGADAVQAGTAFLLCPEAQTTPLHRQALQAAPARPSALTNLFTGRPARGLVNRWMDEAGPMNGAAPAFPLAATLLQPLRQHAETLGRDDYTPLWAGTRAARSQAIPAADVVRALVRGMERGAAPPRPAT